MKKLLMCLMAFVSFALVGCNNEDNDPVVVEDTNYISCNGKVCCKLASAFEGGGIADPYEGASTRLNIFAEAYSSYPSDKKAKVSIEGLIRPDKKYNGNGDYVETLSLKDIPEFGDVNINLNQGVLEGTEGEKNAHVSSVVINSLNYGKVDDKGNRTENANIHITITMDNSAVIEIKYTGKILYDGLI